MKKTIQKLIIISTVKYKIYYKIMKIIREKIKKEETVKAQKRI